SVKPAPHVVEPAVIQPVHPPAPEPAPATSSPEPRAAASEPASTAPVGEASPPVEPGPITTSAGSTLTLVDVRRLWPDIVEATKQRRRVTWIYLTQDAQDTSVDAQPLPLGFANAGARDSFDSGGSAEIVRQAALHVVRPHSQGESVLYHRA